MLQLGFHLATAHCQMTVHICKWTWTVRAPPRCAIHWHETLSASHVYCDSMYRTKMQLLSTCTVNKQHNAVYLQSIKHLIYKVFPSPLNFLCQFGIFGKIQMIASNNVWQHYAVLNWSRLRTDYSTTSDKLATVWAKVIVCLFKTTWKWPAQAWHQKNLHEAGMAWHHAHMA